MMVQPKPRIDVHVLTDTRFNKKPRQEILSTGDIPEQAREFERGPQSMMANAIDERGLIVASAAAHLLVHPTKQPLLHVVYVGANPPYRGQGLERSLVERLIEASRFEGCSGAWISEDVMAVLKSCNHDAAKDGE